MASKASASAVGGGVHDRSKLRFRRRGARWASDGGVHPMLQALRGEISRGGRPRSGLRCRPSGDPGGRSPRGPGRGPARSAEGTSERCAPGPVGSTRVRSVIGEMARQHLVQHRPEAVDVRAPIAAPAADLLGRHVVWRSEGRGQPHPREPPRRLEERDAEVEDLELAAWSEEHVLRLDVAVDHAPRLQVGERVAGLACDVERLVGRERPAAGHLARTDLSLSNWRCGTFRATKPPVALSTALKIEAMPLSQELHQLVLIEPVAHDEIAHRSTWCEAEGPL
jgi:hypothetical protein